MNLNYIINYLFTLIIVVGGLIGIFVLGAIVLCILVPGLIVLSPFCIDRNGMVELPRFLKRFSI